MIATPQHRITLSGRYGRVDMAVLAGGLSGAALRVWVVLDKCNNAKTGQCNPAYRTICEATQLSRSAVSKAVAELEKRGLLQRKKMGKNATVYVLQTPGTGFPNGNSTGFTNVNSEAVQGFTPVNQGFTPVNPYTIKSFEKPIEKPSTPPSTPPPGFPDGNRATVPDEKVIALHVEKASQQEVAQALLDEWNAALPKTTPGANQLADQNALLQLLTTHALTRDQIRGILAHIVAHGKQRYWPRPAYLVRHTGGDGPYAFARILTEMDDDGRTQGAYHPAVRERERAEWDSVFDRVEAHYATPATDPGGTAGRAKTHQRAVSAVRPRGG